MPIYEYECKEHGLSEKLVKMDDRDSQSCDTCGKPLRLLISAVRSALDPISGDFPGATMKWEKTREGKMAQEVKREETGTE
jgi:putative FmdB family regulatory protein